MLGLWLTLSRIGAWADLPGHLSPRGHFSVAFFPCTYSDWVGPTGMASMGAQEDLFGVWGLFLSQASAHASPS